MRTANSSAFGENFIPSKGWAPIAHALTAAARRSTPYEPSVSFCDNPFGGLACTNKDTATIYLSGVQLGEPPVFVPELKDAFTLCPEVIAAYAHEIGHLYEHSKSSKIELNKLTHPSKELAFTTLLEIFADAFGVAKALTTDHKWSQYTSVSSQALQVLASVTTRDFVGSSPQKDALAMVATVFGGRHAISRSKEFFGEEFVELWEKEGTLTTEISPATEEVFEVLHAELGKELTDKFVDIAVRLALRTATHAVNGGTWTKGYTTVSANFVAEWLELYDLIPDTGTSQSKDLQKALAKVTLESTRLDTDEQETVFQQIKEQMEEDAEEELRRNIEQGTEQFGLSRTRVPTTREISARESLRSSLLRLNFPDITRSQGWESLPPGKLRVAKAMQQDALRSLDKFAGDNIRPFNRVNRKVDPQVPLTCGIILDQSGSMKHLASPVAGAGWALAHAVKDIDGKVALVGMGDGGYVIEKTSDIDEDTVVMHEAKGRVENVSGALDKIDEELGLFSNTSFGVRLLVIVSDFEIVMPTHDKLLAMAISDHQAKGGYTLLIDTSTYAEAHKYGATHLVQGSNAEGISQALVDGVLGIYGEVIKQHRAVA